MPYNTGDEAVFFDVAQQATTTDDLISDQLDPTQPQIPNLDTISNPLVVDRTVADRLSNFDPTVFDLSDHSHLMRLLSAFLGASGVGGLRRQMLIARMGNTLNGTNWLELDGFWGRLFSLARDQASEALPSSGSPIASTVATSEFWDQVDSRDGRYRARIEQLAKGFANGATYFGLYFAATAVLNCDVEIVESWLIADSIVPNSALYQGNSWFVVENQYPTWGAAEGKSYNTLSGAFQNLGDTPLGNRGEIVVVPGRLISEAERTVLTQVLNKLAPAGTIVTVSTQAFSAQQSVVVREIRADSNYWDIVSSVQQQQSIDTGSIDLYPNAGTYENARPAMSAYSGEQWTYNGQLSSVTSYVLDADDNQIDAADYDTVAYADGSLHDYTAQEAMSDARRLIAARAMSDGVLTTYPYASARGTS